ncbi:MAG: hypothetical protein EG826_09215 [Deltaproteobacteria bacterium]|nr:hypothetical protein [Deltaproteobacteria bacterium]
MDQQHMTVETNLFDNLMPDSGIFGGIGAMEDQSADIYAAVIGNIAMLPNDDDAIPDDLIPIPKRRYSTIRKVTVGGKVKSRFAKQMQALLQEEHALWLK